jgi:hypothetical protein
MKLARANYKRNGKTEYRHPGPFADELRDEGHTFLSEDAFLVVLRLERKRTERSGKPFLLMLLGVGEMGRDRSKNELLCETASALFAAAREVDVKGWYEHGSVIGVIFAEISGTDDKVTGKIFTKVYQALYRQLGVDLANRIASRCTCFQSRRLTVKSTAGF